MLFFELSPQIFLSSQAEKYDFFHVLAIFNNKSEKRLQKRLFITNNACFVIFCKFLFDFCLILPIFAAGNIAPFLHKF